MSKRLAQAGVVLLLLFAAAQFARPQHANPPIDPARTIQASAGAGNGFVTVVDRACRDCHTNSTVWPWYTQVAPVSWVMAYAVTEGRKAVNFSDWAGYSPEQQRALLAQSCRDVTDGRMPSSAWTMLHPEARLSAADVEAMCVAAQQAAISP